MLGTRDPQRDLFGAASRFSPDLDKLGFYGALAREGAGLFRDRDFASAFAKVGRPSVPPSLLALACLLQHYEGVSDAQVIERMKYDLRWKVALDLDPYSFGAPCVKATFQGFRLRLTLHAKEGLAFEKSVRAARDAGLLPKTLEVALDSTPMRGRGAVKDTFNLLSDAIRSVVREIAKRRERAPEEIAADVGVERHFRAPSIKGDELVDWNDKSSVNAFLDGLLKDCDRTVAAAHKAKCAAEEVALLEKVIDQDVDRTGGDGPSIKKEVAKDRTVSISDPEMRHGRKSSGKTYNGHKAHVAVDTKSGVITAVDVGAPGESDGAKVAALVKQTERLTTRDVTRALGDSAYSSRTAADQAFACGVDLKTKMPTAPTMRLGPVEFRVSRDRSSVICPAGHHSTSHRDTGEGIAHRWAPRLCSSCPLKARCTKADFRQLLVPPDFHEKRRREREARSPRGRTTLKRRVAAEHALGRLKNLGAGNARYFGRTKTRGQVLWCAAVVNLFRIWRSNERRAGPGRQAA